jgi:hypothetical protein
VSDEQDDDLTGIFDDLSPEDFALEPKRGIIAFDKFVKENIQSIRMAYLASEGQINPVAVFADPMNEWVFVPNDDENMGEYVERLREAAKTLKATWFFISRKTMVGSYLTTNEDVSDLADPEVIARLEAEGQMTEGVLYYAERLEDGQREHRHGFMRAEDGRLTQVVEGNPIQTIELFSNILS